MDFSCLHDNDSGGPRTKSKNPPKSQVNNLSILLYWTVVAVDTETIHFLYTVEGDFYIFIRMTKESFSNWIHI